jgi:hypothetical protein
MLIALEFTLFQNFAVVLTMVPPELCCSIISGEVMFLDLLLNIVVGMLYKKIRICSKQFIKHSAK